MNEQAVEAAIVTVANKVTPVAGGLAIFGGVSSDTLFALGGFLVAVVGACVQIYYKRKADRRDAEQSLREAAQALRESAHEARLIAEHAVRMAKLKDE